MTDKKWVGLTLCLTLSAYVGMAQVRVPRLVSDGMVLQRDLPIRIWGWASPGEKVTVKFDGETASSDAEDNGKWVVTLKPRKAGGPYNMDIDGINHIWLKNILVGEVWVCTGRANMQLPMEKVKERYADLIAHADDQIRQFRVGLIYDFKGPRQNATPAHWESANPTSVLSFSAIGYLFARQLRDYFHVPVGIIDASAAEAPAEAWLSAEALRFFPDYQAAAAKYADSAYTEGMTPADSMAPEGLFNGMIAPIDTYTVRGVVSYQGEGNVSRADGYAALWPAFITDWRQHWGVSDLPFIYIQLAAFGKSPAQVEDSRWAVLREAQRTTMQLPGTGMVVTADLEQNGDGEPIDKVEVARRILLMAESIAYSKPNIIFTGPLYHSMKVHGDRVHIEFDEINTALIVKGGGELHGFAVAGDDGKYYPAHAAIEGKVVIAWSEQVPHPTAVRYGWADDPAGINLFNRDILFQDGLPAPPFEGHAKARH
jgi:sialate O-acetylesterase